MVSDDTSSKSESTSSGSDTAAEPSSGYSRGENQKPVSRSYKNNWEAIFGKAKKATVAKSSPKKKKR